MARQGQEPAAGADYLAGRQPDASAFPDPDTFNFARQDADRHLAFGQGLRYCLGANSRSKQDHHLLAELARRYPRLTLV